MLTPTSIFMDEEAVPSYKITRKLLKRANNIKRIKKRNDTDLQARLRRAVGLAKQQLRRRK